jgi:hypothetical protein
MNSPDQHVPVGSSDQSDMPNIVVNARRVADTLAIGSQATEVATEMLKFWLTLEDKQSIEADITAEKPIGDTPAYRKFLKGIFPDTEPTFPYLARYDDALMIVSKLWDFFGKTVRLSNEHEAIDSLKANNHLTGFRDANVGWLHDVDDIGYAWISGEVQCIGALCVWRNRNGNAANAFWYSSRGSLSVIPIFG